MNRQVTVQGLLLELRALSGIAEQEEGGMDWLVPTDGMDDDDVNILEAMGMRRLQEQGAKLDASLRESLKGALDTLAKRIKGIGDLVDMGKQLSVETALEKVVKDAEELLASIATGEKKRTVEKKKQEKQGQKVDQAAQQDQQVDKGGRGQPKQSKGDNSMGGNQALAQQGGAGEKQVQPQQGGAQEGVMIVGGEFITEASMGDPFGLGEGFKASIAKIGQIPLRHRREQ